VGKHRLPTALEAVCMFTEWETLNSGETQIAYCTEAVCMFTDTGTK